MTWDQETSDAELVQAFRQGDKSAADVLIHRHGPRLYNFFAGKVGRGADVLCQATLHDCLAIPEAPAADADHDSFRARLFAAARRRLLDGYRTGDREDRRPIDPLELSMADLEPGLSEAVAVREDQRRLALALRRLPVDFQIALELHYWEGMSSAELGRVLELAEHEVEAHLARSRAQLEARLEHEDARVDLTEASPSSDEPRSG
jgi:RNA polymerase sigma factor (sigma-70 family)